MAAQLLIPTLEMGILIFAVWAGYMLAVKTLDPFIGFCLGVLLVPSICTFLALMSAPAFLLAVPWKDRMLFGNLYAWSVLCGFLAGPVAAICCGLRKFRKSSALYEEPQTQQPPK